MYEFYAISEAAFSLMAKAAEVRIKYGDEPAAAMLFFNSGRQEMTIESGVARIAVHGSLGPDPGFFTGTAYSEIREEISSALADQTVEKIVLDINSPGGSTSGLFDLTKFIREARDQKSITAEIHGAATSGALAIASQADKVIALDIAAVMGSVGVLVSGFVSEDFAAARSSEAPLKGRQLNEPQGQEAVQSLLDDLHEIFANELSEGRNRAGLTPEKINETFGRGGVMSVKQALEVGMIDEIKSAASNFNSSDMLASSKVAAEIPQNIREAEQLESRAPRNKPKGMSTMDKATLRAEHPGLYDQILAEGHVTGETAERDRVEAHIKMATQAGDLSIAAKFISDGSLITNQKVYAEYMVAGQKTSTRKDSEEESPPSTGTEEPQGSDAAQVKALADKIRKGL